MAHSHLSVRHLLQQIETDRSKRAKRDIRPAWLTALVERAAELFEPLAELGRVGFDCRADEEGWSLSLFLGAVEQVGGKSDGHAECVDFRFDLKPLLEQFSRIDDFSWNVANNSAGDADSLPRSCVLIDGLVGENRLRLAVRSIAPPPVGAGLRRLPDVRIEPI